MKTIDKTYTKIKLNEVICEKKSFESYLLDLFKEGYSIVEYKNQKGDIIPYHSHSSPEILIVLSGKIRVVVEEEILDLIPEDILTISAFAIHLLAFPERESRYFRCALD